MVATSTGHVIRKLGSRGKLGFELQDPIKDMGILSSILSIRSNAHIHTVFLMVEVDKTG